jgi:uncharacterized protein (TIGR02246 family)
MRNQTRTTATCLILGMTAALSLSCAGATGAPSNAAPPSTRGADEQSVRQIVSEQADAWNRGDAVAFSRHFAADGISTNLRGQSFVGYDAFLRQHQFLFGSLFRNSKLQQDIDLLRFPEPGLAVVEAVTAVSGLGQMPPGVAPDAKGRLRTRLLEVMTRQGGEWKIVAYHNIDIKPGVPTPEPRGD